MKNFINIRLETFNQIKTQNDLKHNFRIIKSLSQKNQNPNINMYFDKNGKQKNRLELYNIINKKSQQWKKELDIKNYERTGRHLRNNKTHLINGVISFSEQQKHNYQNNKLDIKKLVQNCKNTLTEICKKYKSEILYFVLHLDEETPHFQYHLKNFDEDGYSIFHKIKTKKNLSELQDISFNNFKNLGMKRGIKKDQKNKDFDYITIKKYQEEERKKIREEISNLRNLYKEEKQKLREIKKRITQDNRYEQDEKREKYRLLNEDIKNIKNKEKKDISELQKKLEKLQKIEVQKLKKIEIKTEKNKGQNYEFKNR